jgi:hypothetical protein
MASKFSFLTIRPTPPTTTRTNDYINVTLKLSSANALKPIATSAGSEKELNFCAQARKSKALESWRIWLDLRRRELRAQQATEPGQ